MKLLFKHPQKMDIATQKFLLVNGVNIQFYYTLKNTTGLSTAQNLCLKEFFVNETLYKKFFGYNNAYDFINNLTDTEVEFFRELI